MRKGSEDDEGERGDVTRLSSSKRRCGLWSRARARRQRHAAWEWLSRPWATGSRRIAQERLKGASSKPQVTAEQMEISRLRAELARVTMERDILGKATAYFAKGQK